MKKTAAERRRWPTLPKSVQGAGGTLDIVLVPIPGGHADALGHFDGSRRRIEILKSLRGDQKWNVLFHELCHAALWDSGAHNLISREVEENICDAIATARFRERFK